MSYSLSSSYAFNATSASYVLSASYAPSTPTISSSWASSSLSASYSLTSSLPLNGIITGSVLNTTLTFTKGDGTTFDLTVAQSGSVASASYADSASRALNANSSISSSWASSSLSSISSSWASSSLSSISSSWASSSLSASYTLIATSASYAPSNISTTETFTNKRITKRVLGLTSNSANPTINTDNYDVVHITSQSINITSFTTNLSGTPVDGDKLIISITDSGSAISLTWGSSFENGADTLPSTTVASTRLDTGFFWNTETTKWRCMVKG